MKPESEKPASKAVVTAVVLFYLFAALAMVMANKWVLNATTTPLFFLWVQLAIAAVLFIICHLLRVLPDRLTFDFKTCKDLAPMIVLNVLGLSFSNYTLKYVDASFYQVARGLVLPFTVLTSSLLLSARPSLSILSSCTLVTLGFFIGVFLDAIPVSPAGILFGVLSSAITAIHSVVIKKSLNIVNGSALALSWYMNAGSAVILAPLVVLAGEGTGVWGLFFDGVQEVGRWSPLRTFVVGSLITGVLGFLMSIASLLSIKVTSPITHMVSSAVRGVAASLLGLYYFHDIITTGRAASIAIILAGSALYTWFKHQESQSPAPSRSHSPSPSSSSNGLGNGNGNGITVNTRRASYDYERVPMEDIEKGEAHAAEVYKR